MSRPFLEPILQTPINELDFSQEFKIICEMTGYETLGQLLEKHTSELLQLPGFNYHILGEYVNFLEAQRIGHYLDA